MTSKDKAMQGDSDLMLARSHGRGLAAGSCNCGNPWLGGMGLERGTVAVLQLHLYSASLVTNAATALRILGSCDTRQLIEMLS